MATSIKVENLSKIYRLGEIGTGTISRDLERWFAKIRGKEDPFLKIGQTNDRSKKADSDIVYSLQDINFEIEQGDAVGIIGRNGAGKSTLLKILSRVTSPSTGKINIKGRVASLLEVGTGFHPELTGRENIFLNGAILGMRKKEIQRKLDEIIDFSGVERYIDTPVKRYSSGMYVRLAFAVAAHLESEILIVDEVLAVGDAEFQKKCLGKMGDVSKSDGRTVLFVSHNMIAVQKLCSSAIVLKNGQVIGQGESSNIVNKYLNDGSMTKYQFDGTKINYNQDKIRLINARIDKIGDSEKINISESFDVFLEIKSLCTTNVNFTLMVHSQNEEHILSTTSLNRNGANYNMESGNFLVKCTIPGDFFNCGTYKFTLLVVENYSTVLLKIENIFILDFEEEIYDRGGYLGPWSGIVRPKWNWNLNKTI